MGANILKHKAPVWRSACEVADQEFYMVFREVMIIRDGILMAKTPLQNRPGQMHESRLPITTGRRLSGQSPDAGIS
ncbi:hypothetical protein BVH01_00775 [Pseudomonas sp. PA1(2017)]|uniref:hypothetical protein n=1 Tax=Pseudomonas sp. PA1(2017) TaxID=1932113 RepID=UPI00095D4DDA|nr:hypothetical protein [Pseudomonas sp. PA1(2017)]OLU20508.1 hypothetical protein BVH01_00775 [Pseudomonas sp. PA1(2017)]